MYPSLCMLMRKLLVQLPAWLSCRVLLYVLLYFVLSFTANKMNERMNK